MSVRMWISGIIILSVTNVALAEQVLIRGVALPTTSPTQGIAIADDHPRLPEWIKRGLVRRAPPRHWGSEQATGAPNTEGAGDIITAWASHTPDGGPEWLELTYAETMKPIEVHVVETYNPGALVKITALTPSGMEAILWKGEDPTRADVAAGRGTSVVKVRAALRTNRIRIHLASDKFPGWNEIDAVGIKDDAGKIHWAKTATASSEYAQGKKPGWTLDSSAAFELIESLLEENEQLRAKIGQLEANPG